MTTQINSKISKEHLARKAIVYLRQSSVSQVKNNIESQRLQYALAERARLLGFRLVDIIDKDLGASAASGSRVRPGFQELLTRVAEGDVGIILSRELSRLSRTDKDWCHLMEVCQLFDTLIGDDDMVYDPNRFDDQLVLGIECGRAWCIENAITPGQRSQSEKRRVLFNGSARLYPGR